MLRLKGLVRIVVAAGLALALSGVVVLAQDACTRTYRGDLVLEGNQRLVITEGVLCVGGNIILRDNARLEISNATLRMTGFSDSIWDPYAYINVNDEGLLKMHNIVLEAPGTPNASVQIFASGRGRVEVDGVRLYGSVYMTVNSYGHSRAQISDMTVRVAHVTEGGTLDARNSTIVWGSLGFTGTSRAELSELRQGHYEQWQLLRSEGLGISISLQNTTVEGGWSVQVLDHADVTVRDSVHIGAGFDFRQVPSTIEGMRTGHHAHWALRGEEDTASPGNLTLVNTSIAWWDVYLRRQSGVITFRNSGPTNLFVWDSAMTIRCENSQVKAFTAHNSQLTLDSQLLAMNADGNEGIGLYNSRIRMSGPILIPQVGTNVVWDGSTVGREYEVQVRNNDGDPVRGVRIGLEDPNGRVSHRTTDQEGVVRFTIWFYNRNYDHTWHLLVPQGDTTARVPITLLTSTPVQVTSW